MAREIGGYMGRILRVDLTNERISEEVLDGETLRNTSEVPRWAQSISTKKYHRESNGPIPKTGSCFSLVL